jgi:cytochrome P450
MKVASDQKSFATIGHYVAGQRWKDMRSTLSPAFTSSKMKTMFVLMSDCCQQLVDFLERCYQQPPQNIYNISKGKSKTISV